MKIHNRKPPTIVKVRSFKTKSWARALEEMQQKERAAKAATKQSVRR